MSGAPVTRIAGLRRQTGYNMRGWDIVLSCGHQLARGTLHPASVDVGADCPCEVCDRVAAGEGTLREVRSSLIRHHLPLAGLADLVEQITRGLRAAEEVGRYQLNSVGQVHHDTLDEALAAADAALQAAAVTAVELARQLDTAIWVLGGIDDRPPTTR